jgi:hypothetical protein
VIDQNKSDQNKSAQNIPNQKRVPQFFTLPMAQLRKQALTLREK